MKQPCEATGCTKAAIYKVVIMEDECVCHLCCFHAGRFRRFMIAFDGGSQEEPKRVFAETMGDLRSNVAQMQKKGILITNGDDTNAGENQKEGNI